MAKDFPFILTKRGKQKNMKQKLTKQIKLTQLIKQLKQTKQPKIEEPNFNPYKQKVKKRLKTLQVLFLISVMHATVIPTLGTTVPLPNIPYAPFVPPSTEEMDEFTQEVINEINFLDVMQNLENTNNTFKTGETIRGVYYNYSGVVVDPMKDVVFNNFVDAFDGFLKSMADQEWVKKGRALLENKPYSPPESEEQIAKIIAKATETDNLYSDLMRIDSLENDNSLRYQFLKWYKANVWYDARYENKYNILVRTFSPSTLNYHNVRKSEATYQDLYQHAPIAYVPFMKSLQEDYLTTIARMQTMVIMEGGGSQTEPDGVNISPEYYQWIQNRVSIHFENVSMQSITTFNPQSFIVLGQKSTHQKDFNTIQIFTPSTTSFRLNEFTIGSDSAGVIYRKNMTDTDISYLHLSKWNGYLTNQYYNNLSSLYDPVINEFLINNTNTLYLPILSNRPVTLNGVTYPQNVETWEDALKILTSTFSQAPSIPDTIQIPQSVVIADPQGNVSIDANSAVTSGTIDVPLDNSEDDVNKKIPGVVIPDGLTIPQDVLDRLDDALAHDQTLVDLGAETAANTKATVTALDKILAAITDLTKAVTKPKAEPTTGTPTGFQVIIPVIQLFFMILYMILMLMLKAYAFIVSIFAIPQDTSLFDPLTLDAIMRARNLTIAGFNMNIIALLQWLVGFTLLFMMYELLTNKLEKMKV